MPRKNLIDADLFDWVEYNTRVLETSGIGYAKRSPIGRIIEEAGIMADSYGSRVPFFKNAPSHVQDLDRVLEVLPADLMETIRRRYVDREQKVPRYKLDKLHDTIRGALYMLHG